MHDHELSRLFDSYGPLVLRRARRLLGSQADADEVLQEVFLRLMRHPELVTDEPDLVGWFYRVTTNYCLNRIRDAKRRRQLLAEHVKPNACARTDSEHESLLTMRRLLADADEQQARCAAYVYFDELSYDQVAALKGVSKRTVSHLMDRFKTWARAALDPEPLQESAP